MTRSTLVSDNTYYFIDLLVNKLNKYSKVVHLF